VNGAARTFCLRQNFGGGQYPDLSSIHVSQDMRGKGVGKELFRLAKEWANSRAFHRAAQARAWKGMNFPAIKQPLIFA